MPVLLPLLSFQAILLNYSTRGVSYRLAFLYASLWWGVLLTVATELLSLPHLLNQISLSSFWGIVAITAFMLLDHSKISLPFHSFDIRYAAVFLPLGLIVAGTFLISIISPPNTWDSMTYHMGRVVHWIQNQSVAHYPTNIIRQLYFAPWAEFAIMHLQILSGGGDYFANLVQWFAMCGSLVGATLIAEELGASRSQQLLTAVIAATIPMGILQSSSTQNDYVASFWLVCFIYFGLRLLKERETRLAIPTGAALGLAILTKGTAYIYALPFVLWFLASIITDLRQLLKYTFIIGSIFLTLNSGHYLRNTALWGNPLAADIDHVQTTRRDLPAVLSNLSRNLVSNTWTSSQPLNMLQFDAISRLHTILGIDASDPATSLNGAPFVPFTLSLHEDLAGNGLHSLLILSSLPLLLFGSRNRTSSPARLYCLTLLSSFVLFSLLLKWNPWITRLQLPGFVLCAPLVSIAIPAHRPWVARIIMALVTFAAIPWLFYNESRPLLGEWSIIGADRNALYFATNRGLLDYYDQAASLIANSKDCSAVGVYGDVDAYEYPLWVLVRSRAGKVPRIEHINVENISGTIPLKDFTPCMQIKLHQTL